MSKSKIIDKALQDEINSSLDFDVTIPWPKELTEEILPDHIIFPKELNLFLRNRIQDLIAENGCLRRALEEAEEKIHKKQGIAEWGHSTILGKPHEVATAKIIELSRRCREQIAEIEVLKSKCRNLEVHLTNKETELENERHDHERRHSNTDDSSQKSTKNSQPKGDEDRIKHLYEKLQQTQIKLYESKNICASLKQEINKLHKLLYSEIGVNVNLNNLLNQSGWRGRAEQIHLLQQKITELQSRLSEYEGTQKTSIVSVLERKNLANLRNVEKERRRQIEDSAKQLRQTEVIVEGYKRKLEASKARIKVLEHELNVAKGNIAILNEKRSHDNHLIETLNNRLKTTEIKHEEREIDMKNRAEKFEREYTNLKNDLQSAQLQIDRLRRRLEEREIEIDKLRNGTVPNIWDIKISRNIAQPEELLNNLNHSGPPHSARSTCEPNEYVTLAFAAEAERERLLELITILNRRLDKERNYADTLSNTLRNEKDKSAKLELKIRKLETERIGVVKIDTGYKTKLPKLSKASDKEMNAEQMRLKMELLQEECLALKARLDTVQQDKAEDLATYKQMHEQVRKIFHEACRSKPLPPIGSRSTITV